MNEKPPITLAEDKEGAWVIRCGDRYQDQLESHEALWLIARILMGTKPEQCLRTEQEHKQFWENINGGTRSLEFWQKLLPAPQSAEEPKPQVCTRTDGHDGPCNGFPRTACLEKIASQ